MKDMSYHKLARATTSVGSAVLCTLLALAAVSPANGADHRTPAYTFQTFDVPGAAPSLGYSANYGINNRGEIVGNYSRFAADGVTPLSIGFLFDHGTFINVNLSGLAGYTEVDAINDNGVAVGDYSDAPVNSLNVDFFVRRRDGRIHLLPPVAPGAGFFAGAVSVNDEDTIIGTFTLTPEAITWPFGLQGFILEDGEYRLYNYPGAAQTVLLGINDLGTMVGWWEVAHLAQHGFLVHKDGTVAPVEVPGPFITTPVSINNKGNVVGIYADTAFTSQHGFILSHGVYTTLDYPGTTGTIGGGATAANSINDRGEIVGSYLDLSGNWHGFIATPVGDKD